MRRRKERDGMAIWVVLCIIIVLSIMLMAFIYQRTEVKRQSKGTFIALQAQWVAHSAMQHALLKFRVLPNESYEASALARGLCPFYVGAGAPPSGAANEGPLEVFRSDITSEMGNFGLPAEFAGWGYEVTELKALNSFNRGDNRVHVVQITATGTARGQLAGQVITYNDELIKTVDVERKLSI